MDLEKYVVKGKFEGDEEFTIPEADAIITVPSDFVDGVHTRQYMPYNEFPLKIQILSTGHIYRIHGFHKGMAVYTSEHGYFASRGMYKGKLGEDFIYLDK